ncbi:MAG TPA: DUF3098 domain-containing protein [Bacteroidia bacterium]|jgi:hypothetical protein|nr:DUF3098 domain-containing protein [Bacteroidia bacterium]
MATKEVKSSGPNMHFAFGKKNYTYLIVGIVLLIIGFISLAGGGSTDPNQFNGDELFSTRRMVFAPIVLMLGYIVVAIAILTKPQEKEEAPTEE